MKPLSELDSCRIRDRERELFGCTGGEDWGLFRVFVGGKSFLVIVSCQGGWEHVSVSPMSRTRKTCPTWEEMCEVKRMFFYPEECCVEYHPPESEYVNNHELCLHIWRPVGGGIPRPPKEFV